MGQVPLQSAAAVQPVFIPALMRLRQAIEKERTQCWLLVALLAMACLPSGYFLGNMVAGAFLLLGNAVQTTILPSQLQSHVEIMGLGMLPVAMLFGLGVSGVTVGGAIALAINTYNRQYRIVVRDLVEGPVALMLMEAEYAALIEQAAAERYHPNPHRVNLGSDFLSRVNHFAHYYGLYYRLSYGPAELHVPYTIERNCWLEGLLTGMGGFLCGCGGLGTCLVIPLAYRICLNWPRLVATKQAVLAYLSGQFEGALERVAPAGQVRQT